MFKMARRSDKVTPKDFNLEFSKSRNCFIDQDNNAWE